MMEPIAERQGALTDMDLFADARRSKGRVLLGGLNAPGAPGAPGAADMDVAARVLRDASYEVVHLGAGHAATAVAAAAIDEDVDAVVVWDDSNAARERLLDHILGVRACLDDDAVEVPVLVCAIGRDTAEIAAITEAGVTVVVALDALDDALAAQVAGRRRQM